MTIDVVPLTADIGAEVAGVDLAAPLSDDVAAEIRAALLDHLVLFFRGQNLTDEQHIAMARSFGDVQPPPLKTQYGDNPELQILDQVSPKGDGADNWHSDHSYAARPAMGSILRAVKVPSVGKALLYPIK